MKDILLKSLQARFSNILASPDKEHFEVNCGDGWHALIENTLLTIEDTLKKYSAVLPNADTAVKIRYIKEKFGSLDIMAYYPQLNDSIDDGESVAKSSLQQEIFDILDDARKKSTNICEVCAKPGACRRTTFGLAQTTCYEHYKLSERLRRKVVGEDCQR